MLKINFSSEQVSIALQNSVIWHNNASQHRGFRWYGIVDLKDVSLGWFQCRTNEYAISGMLSTPAITTNGSMVKGGERVAMMQRQVTLHQTAMFVTAVAVFFFASHASYC